jgi:DMSO/TMAO reductase YedYZ molybdopterin-dependent catalytic subunit
VTNYFTQLSNFILHSCSINRYIISILTLLTIIPFSGCNPDNKIVPHNTGSSGTIDVTKMMTPGGEKLQPAEDGPVRSALGEPAIDLATFKLEITGLVDSSYFLTWTQIRDMPAVYSDTILMYCVEGWEVWGDWKGTLVKDLLDKAHVQPDGEYVLFTGVDGYTTALPVSYLRRYNAILAYEVNRSPLKEHDGFPLRLVAFGKFGYKWAKWVNKLEVMNKSQIGYWEGYGFSDEANVPLTRRVYYEGQNARPLEY